MFRKFFNKRRIEKGFEIEDSIMTITQKEEAIIEMPFERRGLLIMWYVVIFVMIILAGRVFYLNFFRGNYYSEVSKCNRIRSIVTKAPRGLIMDRRGNVLARNIPSIDVIIIPNDLPKEEEKRKEIAKNLSDILEINYGNVEIAFNNFDLESLSPELLESNIPRDQALIIAERKNEFPGVELEKTAIRSYSNSSIFSQIIGYDGKITKEELKDNSDYLMTDYIGKAGLEKEYEKEIKGQYGAKKVEVDSLGNVKRDIGVVDPIPGNDLVLNIDEDLQKVVYDSLTTVLEKINVKTAAAVAIDPRNGGVLALVSLPSYDNNLFAQGISSQDYSKLINDQSLPLFNRCVLGEYPPGSTIKPAIAAAALSEKNITSSTVIDGLGGALHIGSFRFGDWKAHAPSDVRRAIAESNDIFFYTIGGGYGNIKGLGMNTMKKYDNLFGFGRPTGIDLPTEATGLIPDEKWKLDKIGERWYIGDSYHAAIGQGFVTATPIQLANYTAALANGGTLYSPRLVNHIKKGEETKEILKPKIINSNFIDSDIMKVVREGMRMVVTDGTAQALKNMPIAVAGKTGTAQFGSEGKTHSWFISFAPYENPTIAMAILVPSGGEGNSAALPATQKILEWYFRE